MADDPRESLPDRLFGRLLRAIAIVARTVGKKEDTK